MKTLVLYTVMIVFLMIKVSAATILWVSIGTNTIFNPNKPTYEVTYTENDSVFILNSGYYLAPYQFGHGEALSFIVTSNSNSSDYWNMEIGVSPTPSFSKLQIGLYENASRAGGILTNQNHIDFAGSGSGDSSTKGWFKILEIEKNETGKITKLAFDFSQQGNYNDPLYMNGTVNGSFRFNSTMPIPEPSVMGIITISSLALFRRKRQ